MGRGKDKTISGSDIANMSPEERAGLGNMALMGKLKVRGTAVVRSKSTGNVKYSDPKQAGSFNEGEL